MELTLSQKFKLSVTLGAIILFIVMFIDIAVNNQTIGEDVEKPFVACYGCSHYDADTNSCIDDDKWSKRCEAGFPTDTLEERWYPGELTESGDSQKMPELEEKTSHDRFKELCYKYGLNPSAIREVENKYNIREGIILAIIIAETSGGKNGYGVEGCWNYGNVGNNDRGDRYCFTSESEGLNKIGRTLSNDYLGTTQTLGCLSKAGSCTWWENKGHIYASSDGNWERTMLNVLNAIYQDELGTIEPERFNVRRVFTIYQ